MQILEAGELVLIAEGSQGTFLAAAEDLFRLLYSWNLSHTFHFITSCPSGTSGGTSPLTGGFVMGVTQPGPGYDSEKPLPSCVTLRK